MITPDEIPLWFAIPTIVVGWAWLTTLAVRSVTADPDPDALTGLDVLERTGVHPG